VQPEIDWLTDGDVPALQLFVAEHMRPGHVFARDAELVRWQYRSPDHAGRLSMLAAREHEQIVGVLGLIDVAFCVGGRRTPGGWLATWTAARAAREGQVGLRLLQRMLAEPRELIGVVGITDMALRIYRALGFAIRASIPRWVLVVDEDALRRLLGQRGAVPRRAPSGASTGGRLTVTSWSEAHAQGWDEVWRRRLAPQLIGTWRDAEYLRWRYLEHPRFSYSVRVAEDADGELRGLAVHRIVEVRGAEGRVARIVDVLGDREASAALLADVIAAAERAGAAFAEFYCSGDAVAGALRDCGFTLELEPAHTLPALTEPLNVQLSAVVPAAFHVGGATTGASAGTARMASDAAYITRSDGDQDRPQ
jgi:Acetyltransferase (GNAT) domain